MKYLKSYWPILLLLILGIFVRIVITLNGNFIFHMDNARDMVDIREMVVLQKLRLIGPTSGIEGFFTGPLWYYISAIPFLLSGGDPYASILMQIFFWAVGAYFLLQIIKRWGIWVMGAIGGVWVASNLVILNSQHSLSPNPIILLMPLFIYLFERYLNQEEKWVGIACWIFAGLVFQLEMAFGIFMPLIIIAGSIWVKRKGVIKDVMCGLAIFSIALLPQAFFDLRHQFLMSNSLLHYFSQSLSKGGGLDIGAKVTSVFGLYSDIYSGLMMNHKTLIFGSFAVLSFAFFSLVKKRELLKDKAIFVSSLIIFIPLLGYLILPIKAMHWHAQAGAGAFLILLANSLGRLGKLGVVGVSLVIMIYSVVNLQTSYLGNLVNLNKHTNPSILRNELLAIDYVYQKAQGKDFKVYVYMPSIIDYPYQYLFWWYGLNKYGYLPADYAYLPNVPEYISNKNSFSNLKVLEKPYQLFLIKEPDTRDERHLWENSFNNLPTNSKVKLGSLEIEEKKAI